MGFSWSQRPRYKRYWVYSVSYHSHFYWLRYSTFRWTQPSQEQIDEVSETSEYPERDIFWPHFSLKDAVEYLPPIPFLTQNGVLDYFAHWIESAQRWCTYPLRLDRFWLQLWAVVWCVILFVHRNLQESSESPGPREAPKASSIAIALPQIPTSQTAACFGRFPIRHKLSVLINLGYSYF